MKIYKFFYNIILFLFILLMLFLMWRMSFVQEGFSSNTQMYVISLKHEDRIKNIEKQQGKINEKIEIFDAVKGDQLDINELLESGIVDVKYKNASKQEKRVIGCYMSHLNLLNEIKNKNESGYTIIFEDDFDIVNPNFLDDVKKIIDNMKNNKIDFDLILLGNLNDNKGEQIMDNIYKIDQKEHLWGTHGYLVNNSNIEKIIEKIKIVDNPIDIKYEILGKNNVLNINVINPTIVNQQMEFLKSNINDLSIDTFSNMKFF